MVIAALFATLLLAWLVPFPFVAIFALVGGCLVGLPLYTLAERKGWASWKSSGVSGFVLAATPIAIFLWPVNIGHEGQSYVHGVLVRQDGIPTLAGWLQYGEFVGYCAVAGALAGLLFYLINRQIDSTN